ncbi:MAG TPA: hypothetical protein VKF62_13755 [Planctomycetota bacterium]|nr:hypothetical protein [Planctomycetota bacterium]
MIAILVSGATLLGLGEPVRARVPGSYLQVSLALEGFEGGEEGLKMLAEFVGPSKAVLSGAIAPEGGHISVIAEKDEPHRSSAEWRAELKGDPAGEPGTEFFEVEGIACSESRMEEAPLAKVDWNAYPVSMGVGFDLHVSWFGPSRRVSLTREGFAAIVRSFRVGLFRRGSWDDFPPDVNEFFHSAGARAPEEVAWAEAQCKARPEDWAAHFALGELALAKKAAGKAPQAYGRAVALLKKKKEPTAQETFAWVLAEEGWGLDLALAGKASEAIPHLKAGYDLAGDRKVLRAPLAFNLACAHGLKGDAPNAVKFLREAGSLESRYGELARKDERFDKVRASKLFQDFLATLPTPAAGKK